MTMTTVGVVRTRVRKGILVGVGTLAIIAASVAPAHAQAQAQGQTQPKFELGASLANLTIGLGDNDFTSFGVPSSFFGLLNPGVYASIFAGPNISIDPQVGLTVLSGGGETAHILTLAGQVNYFTKGTDVSSPYIFGNVGLITATDSDSTTTFGGGVGYRIRAGDRLAFRLDGRLTHFGDGGGNTISVNLSLGGL